MSLFYFILFYFTVFSTKNSDHKIGIIKFSYVPIVAIGKKWHPKSLIVHIMLRDLLTQKSGKKKP
jgi:hypothetical protein